MIDTIVLDDGIEYAIVKELRINNIEYTLFANTNNPEDICFRKTIIENGDEYYTGLDSDTEVDLVMNKFAKYILENPDELK